MRSRLSHPTANLIALLLFNLVLLSVQVRTEEGRILIRAIGLSLITPINQAFHFLSDSGSSLFSRYLWLLDTAAENQRLQQENDALRLQLNRLRNQAALASRGTQYERVTQASDFSTLVAAVVGANAPFHEDLILINAGTRHGVAKDAAVISPLGIVGRVFSAGPFHSEVELITNPDSAAGALLEGSRLLGVAVGLGSDRLRLDYIPNSEEVEAGQPVVTSGLDRIYPKGLPIGIIENFRKSSLIYQEIEIRPWVDFRRLEEVLVVIDQPEEVSD